MEDINTTQDIQEWIDNNQSINGKVKNREIIDWLDFYLDNNDQEKIELVLSAYDKDFFQNNRILPLENLVSYYVSNIVLKKQETTTLFQNQIKELLAITNTPKDVFHKKKYNIKTKPEELFMEASELMNTYDLEDSDKIIFIQSFFEIFPEFKPEINNNSNNVSNNNSLGEDKTNQNSIDNQKINKNHDIVPESRAFFLPAVNIVEIAVKNNFGVESLKTLKNLGFSLYEPNGRLLQQAMSSKQTFNFKRKKDNNQEENIEKIQESVTNLLLEEGNQVNILSIIHAIQSNKNQYILKTLLSHYPDEFDINQSVFSQNDHDPNSSVYSQTNIFKSLMDRKDFDGHLQLIKPFLEKGLSIPYDDYSLVILSVERGKSINFIDKLLYLSRTEKHNNSNIPTYQPEHFIDAIIDSQYHDPEIVNILDYHGLFSANQLINPKSKTIQHNMEKWEAQESDNEIAFRVVEKLEEKQESYFNDNNTGYFWDKIIDKFRSV